MTRLSLAALLPVPLTALSAEYIAPDIQPAAHCLVYQKPKTQRVVAVRWSSDDEKWMPLAEGKAGVDDRAVLQQACDSVPQDGGEVLVRAGRYHLDGTLFVRRAEMSLVFERGALLAPSTDFAGYLLDISPEKEDIHHLLKRVKVTGLRVDGCRQSKGVRHCCVWYFTHADWNIENTRGEALWLDYSSIEGAFYDINIVECGTHEVGPAVRIGSSTSGADHANNISFFNFRIVFPHASALEIGTPPRQRQPVRNLYFYGTQVHWLIAPVRRNAANEERFHQAHAAVDMIRIRNGHDIHFLGGNFQMMANRGRCFVLGESEKVEAVTIKGRLWGGGEGATHLAVVNADHLFLPCMLSLPRGTAVNWGESAPTVHQPPVVLAGSIKGTSKKAR